MAEHSSNSNSFQSEEARRFLCKYCGKASITKRHLTAHMSSHTKEKPYKCEECNTAYSSSYGLKSHVNSVHKKQKYDCPFHNCAKGLQFFTSRQGLKDHINVIHKKTQFLCSATDCRQKFCSSTTLRRHERVVHDPDSDLNSRAPCPICKEMIRKVRLPAHLHMHKNQMKKFNCSTCSKSFLTVKHLKSHEATHLSSDDRPAFKCDFCDLKYASETYKKIHMNLKHSLTPKTFDCSFCDKKCNNSVRLADHLRTHTGETPFPCSQCERSFISKTSLFTHTRSVHIRDRKYKCSHCPKTFLAEHRRQSHTAIVHEGKTRTDPCPTCGKVFSAPSTLRRHLETHEDMTTRERNFMCEVCNKGFMTLSHLKQHGRTHSKARPHTCSECGKTFAAKGTLTQHMATHLNEKHTCEFCDLDFKNSIYLRSHISLQHGNRKSEFKCAFCEAKFKSSSGRNYHIRRHLGETPVSKAGCGSNSEKCRFCSKTFPSMAAWGLHVQTHPEFRKTKEFGESERKTNFNISSALSAGNSSVQING